MVKNKRPKRVDGILKWAYGMGKTGKTWNPRCRRCKGELNVIDGQPGIEICRVCAIAYCADKSLHGSIYHLTDIIWPKDTKLRKEYSYYRSANISWHPEGHPCVICGTARKPTGAEVIEKLSKPKELVPIMRGSVIVGFEKE